MDRKQLYSIKTYRGAFLYLFANPDEETATDYPHTLQLIGSFPPVRVNAREVTPYTGETAYIHPVYPTVESLAQEAVTTYKLDPARVQRAAEIVSKSKTNCLCAKFDENHQPISRPSYEVQAVRSQDPKNQSFYVVRKGSCTCHDSRVEKNICKHRIAAWITRELAERPTRNINTPERKRQQEAILIELGMN